MTVTLRRDLGPLGPEGASKGDGPARKANPGRILRGSGAGKCLRHSHLRMTVVDQSFGQFFGTLRVYSLMNVRISGATCSIPRTVSLIVGDVT